MGRNRVLVGSIAVAVSAACVAPERTGPGEAHEALSAAVTGEAARSVGADGRFVLSPPPFENLPVLSESDARGAAGFAARTLAPLAGPLLRSQHGGPIDWASLEVCGPTYYARSPFVPYSEDLPDPVRYYLGSHWIVATCSPDGHPVLSVAVAATAVAVREIPAGWVLPPGSIRMVGIPATWQGALPVSPEGAAILAAERSQARVSTVPVLYAPNPFDEFPQGAYWRFEMDTPLSITGRTSGAASQSTLLRVGSASIPSNAMLRGPVDLFAPRPNTRLVVDVSAPTREGGHVDLRLQVRPEAVLDLERVIVRKVGAQ